MPLSRINAQSLTDASIVSAEIADGAITTAKLADNAVTTAKVNPTQTDITSVGTLTSFRSTGIDDNADALAMTIDSSENILFGKTSSSLATDGIEAKANGSLFVTRSSAIPVSLRRSSDDGEIIKLYQDGTNIGSIGSRSGVALNIVLDPRDSGGNGGSGLTGVGDVIRPTNYTGSNTDNHVILGSSSFRFKDLHLSNRVKLSAGGGIEFGNSAGGRSVSSTLLDDYEEGTFTPDVKNTSSSSNFSVRIGNYTKIGRKVFVHFYCDGGNTGTAGSFLQISGLPFTTNAGSGAVVIGQFTSNGSGTNNGGILNNLNVVDGGSSINDQKTYFSAMLHYNV